MTTRAAIYVRLSRETEESTSAERQRDACVAEAERRGWQVVVVEEDIDVSATKRRLNRPGLDRLRARYHDFDVLLFWKTDRLARSTADFAHLMEEAEQQNVALVSATEPIDLSTPMGRAMGQIVAIFAELEAKTIGLRVTSAQAHLTSVGRARGGSVIWGYTTVDNPDGPGKIHTPDPERAALLRDATDRLLRGESVYSVCQDWNARGVPCARGGTGWTVKVLSRVLRHPMMAGKTVHRGQIVRDDSGMPVRFWEPILDEATHRALVEAMDVGARPHPGRRWDSEHLLAGLLRCGECGGPLYAFTSTSKTSGFVRATYQCRATAAGRTCAGVSVTRKHIEAAIERDFLARFGRMQVVRHVEVDAVDNSDEMKDVQAAMSDLETDRYERGLFAGDAGAERFARLYGRLEARLGDLETNHHPGESYAEETGQTFAEAWDAEDVAGRRGLLASALHSVAVRKGAAGRRGFDESRMTPEWYV